MNVVVGDGAGCDLAGTNEGLLNHIIIIISIVGTQLKPVENIAVSYPISHYALYLIISSTKVTLEQLPSLLLVHKIEFT